MIRSLKASAVAFTLALTSSYSLAADKVVVIPMGGSDVSAKEFNQQHVWSGNVLNSAKFGAGLYTVSHTSTGKYNITLNLDGFKFYNAQPRPIVAGWGSGPGSTVHVQTLSTTEDLNGLLVGAGFSVYTYDNTNTFADNNFIFHAKISGSNSPVLSSASAKSAADNGATCTTKGELVTCVIGGD